jgi:hypothetical protein
MEKLIITPKTKIYDFLEAYPQLEDELISLAPEFRKLKNPVLRKTIARVATIGQAASVSGLNVEHLVNRLREMAGQGNMDVSDDAGSKYVLSKPDWFDEKRISETIDIREMLNRGEQPVHEVLSSIKKLDGDQILEVIAPFLPAPLLDKSVSLDYRHWVDKKGEGDFRVYFRK